MERLRAGVASYRSYFACSVERSSAWHLHALPGLLNVLRESCGPMGQKVWTHEGMGSRREKGSPGTSTQTAAPICEARSALWISS